MKKLRDLVIEMNEKEEPGMEAPEPKQSPYQPNKTLDAVGQSMGVTRERVRQIESQYFEKIAHGLLLNPKSDFHQMFVDSKGRSPTRQDAQEMAKDEYFRSAIHSMVVDLEKKGLLGTQFSKATESKLRSLKEFVANISETSNIFPSLNLFTTNPVSLLTSSTSYNP